GLTNGEIRVELPLPGIDGVALTAAIKSIFEVAPDAPGGFTPIQQPFSVVQRVRSQGVTGQISNAATSQPVTNALVGLFSNCGDIIVAATDTNGKYLLYCSPGAYV